MGCNFAHQALNCLNCDMEKAYIQSRQEDLQYTSIFNFYNCGASEDKRVSFSIYIFSFHDFQVK